MHTLPSPSVQLITGSWRDVADLRTRVDAALRGGIRWLQLRAKDRPARELYEAAVVLAPMLREAGALFVINDRVDVALAVGAGGVHLPENGMSPLDARRLLGGGKWIARSVHSIEELLSSPATVVARSGELDAVQFGPVFDTASKRGFGPPQGIGELMRAAEAARSRALSLIAVGGISSGGAADCRHAGAAAVSVIGAIWDAGDVEAAARAFAPA